MCRCTLRFDPDCLEWSIAVVLEVGCRLLIAECREKLRLRGDARGCNGHRRRRMVKTTTYPGTMPVAFARKARLRAIAFLTAVGILGCRRASRLWTSKVNGFHGGFGMCGCIIRLDPARLLGSIAAVLEVGCRLLLIAGCKETLQRRGDVRGCNGHRRRRMVISRPTRVRCPSRLREKARLRANRFF